jgi:predicted glycosyltransferase
MRVWVDITDAASVVFFAPVVRRLEDAGHTVTLTARRFAGADLVLRRYGLGGVLTTQHRGGSLGTRAVGLVNRTAQLLGSASSGRFDVAAGSHASDFVLTAWTLAIPQMTFLDPDRLGRSNLVNVRLVDEVAVPEAVPVAGITSLGATREKLFRYPGFKEEYYLHDAQPDPAALGLLGVERRHVAGIVRPPAQKTRLGDEEPAAPDEAGLFDLLAALAGRRNLTLVVVARDQGQRQRVLALGLRSVVVPEGPVDGVGLLAAADFAVGMGGVMLREAAALGTPAYTLSSSASPVEASLLGDGRLKRVTGADDIVLRKKETRTSVALPRDPWLFADRLIELARRRSRRARLGRLVQDAADQPPGPLV